jgi:hypothetical protein
MMFYRIRVKGVVTMSKHDPRKDSHARAACRISSWAAPHFARRRFAATACILGAGCALLVRLASRVRDVNVTGSVGAEVIVVGDAYVGITKRG